MLSIHQWIHLDEINKSNGKLISNLFFELLAENHKIFERIAMCEKLSKSNVLGI